MHQTQTSSGKANQGLSDTIANDPSTSPGNGALCNVIERYWRSLGYNGVIVVSMRSPCGDYTIRSNIVDGYPPWHRTGDTRESIAARYTSMIATRC